MPILDLQRTIRQVGRIRMGEKGDKGQPKKLTTWRLTSPDKAALEGAAALYGGTVQPWDGQAGQFELYTTSDELPILLAPLDMSQWYEEWAAGGCKKRCDGQTCTLATPEGAKDVPCDCDPEARTCKMVTRLSVMLPELPAIGCWRLDTHGYYAATELPATAESLIRLSKQGRFVPAFLAIEQRTVKRNNQTRQFIVPVIRVRERLLDVLAGRSAISLEAGEYRELPPDGGSAALPAPLPDVPPADEDGVVQERPEPNRDLEMALGDFDVKGVARDWILKQNPSADACRTILQMIVDVGRSVNASVLKAAQDAKIPDWNTFAAAIRKGKEMAEAKAAESNAEEPADAFADEQPGLAALAGAALAGAE